MIFSRFHSVKHRWVVLVCCAPVFSWFHPSPILATSPQHLIKIATLAPEASSWIKTVRAIDQEVRTQTDGAVGFKIYPGGVQGDDNVLLRKMRIGQLQGAGLTGQGLTIINSDILALQMPFLFDSYDEVDYILEKMDDFYHQGMEKNGFVLLGWSDIGFVHLLSKKPIRSVDDIRQRKVWRLEDEPITQVIFRKAGVNSVPLTIPDVLLGLQTNMIDVAYAPPAAAIVMQWFTRVQYITELPINYTLGALVVDKRFFDKIPTAHQQILHQVSAVRMRRLALQTRRENSAAIQVMLDNGLELVTPLPADVKTFADLVEESIPELVGKSVSQETYDRVHNHLKAFRQQRMQAE